MSNDIASAARRRTRTAVATVAAVILALVVVVAGLVVAVGHRGDRVRDPAVVPATPTAGTVESSSAGAAGVGDMSWSTVAGAEVPISATAGPSDSSGGQARGFAHTLLGAVMAAANISVRLSPQVGPLVFEPTLHEQVVGRYTSALSEHLDEDYRTARARAGVPYGGPAGRLYSTTTGYQVDMLGLDTATVRLLIEGPGQDGGSVLVALVTQVQWTGADWVLQAPNRGDWNTDTAVVTDAFGYTIFRNRPADGC